MAETTELKIVEERLEDTIGWYLADHVRSDMHDDWASPPDKTILGIDEDDDEGEFYTVLKNLNAVGKFDQMTISRKVTGYNDRSLVEDSAFPIVKSITDSYIKKYFRISPTLNSFVDSGDCRIRYNPTRAVREYLHEIGISITVSRWDIYIDCDKSRWVDVPSDEAHQIRSVYNKTNVAYREAIVKKLLDKKIFILSFCDEEPIEWSWGDARFKSTLLFVDLVTITKE